MTRPADAKSEATGAGLMLTGQALPKKAPGERNTGVRFRAEMKVTTSGGRTERETTAWKSTRPIAVTLRLSPPPNSARRILSKPAREI